MYFYKTKKENIKKIKIIIVLLALITAALIKANEGM
jgi:hypothetical protein